MRGECLKVAPKYGIEFVADETYGATDTDMTAQLPKIKGSGAMAVLNAGFGEGPAQKPVVVGYSKAFEDKYKADVSTFGGHAYDGLMLAVNAIKAAGSTDKAKVRDALEATKGYVGTGGVVNMSAPTTWGWT